MIFTVGCGWFSVDFYEVDRYIDYQEGFVMDKPEDKSRNWKLIGGFVGALMGGVGFFPISIFFEYLLSFRYNQKGMTDFGALAPCMICWNLSLLSGAFGGLAGAFLARKRYKRFGPWVGACIGGLLGALIPAFLVQSSLFFW
jgi:hypothetical protein